MRLIPNARKVALHSHSMRAQWAGLAVLIAPEVLFLALGYDVSSPRLWWAAGVGLIAYGLIGRLIDQGIGDGK